jgi:hypothetical protein
MPGQEGNIKMELTGLWEECGLEQSGSAWEPVVVVNSFGATVEMIKGSINFVSRENYFTHRPDDGGSKDF